MRIRPPGPVARAIGVGAILFLIFGLLGTQQYTVADGALRCLDVFRRPVLFFAGNNHLLYPANVLAWHRLLAILGVSAGDPLGFLHLTELMNAAAAAATAALVYWIARTESASEAVALAAAAGLAFSRAFLLHATSSAEPMVGLFWSMTAVTAALVATRRGRAWPAAVAGLALALALASYESMVAVAPAALLLAASGPRPRGRVVALVAGATLATALIYAFAYASSGTSSPGGMLSRFFEVPGESVWGGVSLSKLAHLPLGAVQSLLAVLPPGFAGLRSLAHGTGPAALVYLTAALGGVAALVVALLRAAHAEWPAWSPAIRARAIALTSGLLCASLVLPLWDSLYDKLWLQPLALAFLLGALVLARGAAERHRRTARAALVLVVLEIAVNLSWAVPAHRSESPYLEPSRVVAQTVKPGDLIVLDWDPVSELYHALWSRDRQDWSLPTAAALRGPAALAELDQAVEAARARGSAVYFVGVLDESPAAWDSFLGRRLHLPYAALDRYRTGARIVARFGPTAALTLRRL